MSTSRSIILIGLAAIAAIAAWAYMRKRRTTALRGRFGPEYEHAVQEYGSRAAFSAVRFVDDPPLAIREADQLVCEVMRTKSYPMADFDRRAEDLSVDHPHVVRNYRTAHAIAITEPEGSASTEDLRQAMAHYRELVDELLETHPAGILEKEIANATFDGLRITDHGRSGQPRKRSRWPRTRQLGVSGTAAEYDL